MISAALRYFSSQLIIPTTIQFFVFQFNAYYLKVYRYREWSSVRRYSGCHRPSSALCGPRPHNPRSSTPTRYVRTNLSAYVEAYCRKSMMHFVPADDCDEISWQGKRSNYDRKKTVKWGKNHKPKKNIDLFNESLFPLSLLSNIITSTLPHSVLLHGFPCWWYSSVIF